MGYIDEQIILVSKIVNGEIKRFEVEAELLQMEKKYGSDCFDSYPVKRKPKPWSKKYLNELEGLSNSGASSKDFYLYMSEVSDEIYKNKIKKKVIIAVAAVIIIGTFLIVSFSNFRA